MTPEAVRIAKEALELAEKATPGPWKLDHDWTLEVIDRDEHNVAKLPHHMASTPSNAAFIAYARTALPILARAVLESRSAEEERADVVAFSAIHLAQLRHLYEQMVNGRVTDTADAARGLLGPAIARFEDIERGEHIGAADKSRKEPK